MISSFGLKKRAKKKIEFENVLSRAETIAYVEAILDGLKKGTLRFKQGDTELALSVPNAMEVEVEAQRDGAREKIEFELSWRVEDFVKIS